MEFENGKQPWRFLNTGSDTASFNMAVDEVVARHSRLSKPTLRVYAWEPVAISIGFHQQANEIDVAKCNRDGLNLVRRATGGNAIYHADEVTYSVAIPKSSGLYTRSATSIFRMVSAALLTGLRRIDKGLCLQRLSRAGQRDRAYESDPLEPACFATAALYEIQYHGKKVVGSAQRRFATSVLQHGSIILSDRHLDLVSYLAKPEQKSTSNLMACLASRTISFESILQRKVTYGDVVPHLHAGFEEAFNIQFAEDELTEEELALIERYKLNYQHYGGYHHA